MQVKPKVTPWLGFRDQAEEAAKFYSSVIPESRVLNVARNPATGSAMVVAFELGGLPVFALNTGQEWRFTEAFSLSVSCDTQEEIDRIWTALTSGGGKEVQCGWLVDRYGVSWQVVPSQIAVWMGDPDPVKSGRTMAALMQMTKLDIATLQAAYEGRPPQA